SSSFRPLIRGQPKTFRMPTPLPTPTIHHLYVFQQTQHIQSSITRRSLTPPTSLAHAAQQALGLWQQTSQSTVPNDPFTRMSLTTLVFTSDSNTMSLLMILVFGR